MNSIEKHLIRLGIKDENSRIIFEKISPQIQANIKIVKKQETIKTLPRLEPNLKGNIDMLLVSDNKLKIRGWSIIPKEKGRYLYKIVLSNNKINYVLETNSELRKDITTSFNDGFNYDYSGFNLSVDTNTIEKGKYNVFVLYEGKERAIFNPGRVINLD